MSSPSLLPPGANCVVLPTLRHHRRGAFDHLKEVGSRVASSGGERSLGGSGRRVQGGHDPGAHFIPVLSSGVGAGDKGSGWRMAATTSIKDEVNNSTTVAFLSPSFDEAVDISPSRQCCPGTGGPRCWLATGHLLFNQLGKDGNGKTARSRGAEREGGRRSDRVGRIGCQVPARCIPFLVWSHTLSHSRPDTGEKTDTTLTARPPVIREQIFCHDVVGFACGIVARRLDVERRLDSMLEPLLPLWSALAIALAAFPRRVHKFPQISAKEARAGCSR